MNTFPAIDSCAAEILDVVPAVMRTIKNEMRRRRASGLSVPQFRAMIFINRQGQAALVQVAEHLGLTSATACRMMDELVARQLVLSRPSTIDRRKITLTLTAEGQAVLENARQGTLHLLEQLLAGLSPADNAAILQAMAILRQAFASHAGAEAQRPGSTAGAQP
jgi:DNA-binding MarR family transcriptional regulator